MKCEVCNISFTNKRNLEHHLKTNKHANRLLDKKGYVCVTCGKQYSHKQTLNKHKTLVHKQDETVSRKEIELLEAKHEKEKEELKKQIEQLLEKVGSTTNNTNIENQTININYYGSENVSYIKDKFIGHLMLRPPEMVPRIIKHIHFNPAHPENHNVKITNKKLPYVSIYKNNKWELDDKKTVIHQLVHKGYKFVETRCDLSPPLEHLSESHHFNDFRDKFINNDVDCFKRLHHDTELCILNNQNVISKLP